ncbi:hypothetical protein ACFQS7_24290 [Dankookia sp. GCM10030260]|uniref:hypothetical protein n=1 Tax=Dankookia sp. GCM10030260 TaxID=3273390 RepID=UPI0036101F95
MKHCDSAKLSDPDTAGIGMAAAKWLADQKGAMIIASDASGREVLLPRPPAPGVSVGHLAACGRG